MAYTKAAQKKLQVKKGSKATTSKVSGKPLKPHKKTATSVTEPDTPTEAAGANTAPQQQAAPTRPGYSATPLAESIIATANGTFVPGANFDYEQELANEETRLKQAESEYDQKLQESEVDRTKALGDVADYEKKSKGTSSRNLAARGMAFSGAASLNARNIATDVGKQTTAIESAHTKAHEAYNGEANGAVGSLRMKSRLDSKMNKESLAAKKRDADLAAEREFNLNKASAQSEIAAHDKEEADAKAAYDAETAAMTPAAAPAAPAAATVAAQRSLRGKGTVKAGKSSSKAKKAKVGKKK